MRRSDRIDTSASCTSGRQRVISSTRATAPARIAVSTGDGTSAAAAGPLREQQRVVPAVAQLVLGGAGGALHGQRAGAADGGGQQLGQHRLGGAGLADQQQAALAGERDHAPLDQRALADELRVDGELGRQPGPRAPGQFELAVAAGR